MFDTTDDPKAAKHCSRSCASKASVTEDRREAMRRGGMMQRNNLLTPSETLGRREAWKYDRIAEELGRLEIEHEFEYELEDKVFDLCLSEFGVIVEFDGPEHNRVKQQALDAAKDGIAQAHGYRVYRVPVSPASRI